MAQDNNTHRFWNEVQTIKATDNIFPKLDNPIIFIGSSSIVKWKTMQVNFGHLNVENRGFGGSTIEDVIYYYDDIVLARKPRQIVIYVGDNDFVVDKTTTPDSVLNRTKILYNKIINDFPDISIVYISLKPSPSRMKYFESIKTANTLIKEYFSTTKNVTFVDIFSKMLDKKTNTPIESLFIEDNLHLSDEGYKLWEKEVQSHLLKYTK